MAEDILPKSPPKLHQSLQNNSVFLDIIVAGNQMAQTLMALDAMFDFPNDKMLWVTLWCDAMARWVVMDLWGRGSS